MAGPSLIEIPMEGTPPPQTFNPLIWSLTVDGMVRSIRQMKYGEILFLRNETRMDNYRKFGWDPGDVSWEGFPVRYILSLTQPSEDARFVVFHSESVKWGLSIAQVLEYNPLLTFKMNGETLTLEQGGPLRLVYDDGTNHYGVKWINRIELAAQKPEGPQ